MASLSRTSIAPSVAPHLHYVGEQCPWCDQPITHEKFEEIQAKLKAEERERTATLERTWKEQSAREMALAIQTLKEQAAAREDVVRDEAKKAAEAAVTPLLAELEAAKRAAYDQVEFLTENQNAELHDQLERQRETFERAQAEAVGVARQQMRELEGKLQAAASARAESTRALDELKATAAANEEAARRDATLAIEAKLATQIAAAAEARRQSEQKLQAAVQEKAELEEAARRSADQVESLKQKALEQATVAHEEGKKAAEFEAAAQLAAAAQAKANAEEQLRLSKSTHESDLNQHLLEQRQALEQAQTEAVNSERSKAFEEKLKLENALRDLQRKLENKTAAELGEGAEVQLFEALKAEFRDDNISRVEKGTAGADILHEVVNNGKICGLIVYDSKKRTVWRSDYANKLRQDQLSAKADHAVLSTSVFPAGERYLHNIDGVIIVTPNRAVSLVQILRKHTIKVHTLRLSNEARDQKTETLYRYITSDRCFQLLNREKELTDHVLDVDVKEKNAHDATWKRRGELLRSLQRAQADFSNEIEQIIGATADGGAVT